MATSKQKRKKNQQWYKQEIYLRGVRPVDIALMSKHLSVMLTAGLTVPDALDVMADQANGPLKKVMKRVAKRVKAGSAFGDALALEKKTFNASFVSAVRIGESSGTLDENLTRLADQLEQDIKLRRNIQSALLYPGVVLSFAVILGFGVAIYVLPEVADIFQSLRVELPWTTRALIQVARFFENFGFIAAAVVLVLFVGFIWMAKRPLLKPIVDRISLSIPVFGVFIHLINRARFARTIGTLLESGTPIQEALEITYETLPNYQYAQATRRMIGEVGAGSDFASVMKKYPYLFPKLMQRMVSVGEKSASLGKTSSYLAAFYEEQVLVMSKNISTLIEPFLLIFIGAVVGLLAVAVLTPIYSVLSGVGA